MFEDEENDSAVTWTFARTDINGVTTTSSFTADKWPFALQQFVNFLKGSGYGVDSKSIGINGNKHLPEIDDIEVDHGWYGAMFYPEGNQKQKQINLFNFKFGGND